MQFQSLIESSDLKHAASLYPGNLGSINMEQTLQTLQQEQHMIDCSSGCLNELAKLVPAFGEQLGPLEAGHPLQDDVLVRSLILVLLVSTSNRIILGLCFTGLCFGGVTFLMPQMKYLLHDTISCNKKNSYCQIPYISLHDQVSCCKSRSLSQMKAYKGTSYLLI